MQKLEKNTTSQGFTIVELLIVIVVIGILAAITIVSYNGIITRAHQSKLISDVGSAGMLMSVEQSSSGAYPSDRNTLNNGRGLQSDADITYNFYSTQSTFCISALSTHSGVDTYYVSETSLNPTKGSCPQDLGPAVATVAGSGAAGFANGVGTAAILYAPVGLVADPAGNLYFTDGASSRIRMVTTSGTVTTIAGAGGQPYAEGTGSGAVFNWPQALTLGNGGVLYVADTNNNRVRSLTTGGVSSFIAGNTLGDAEGTGAAALFRVARGIAYSSGANRIYIADSENNKLRVSTTGGVVTTLAGQVSGGLVDGTGAAAKFNYPQGLAVDSSGNIYVADTLNHAIRKVTTSGVVTTIAGGGTTTYGQSGYVDANGKTARFKNPMGVTVDSTGNVYVADSANNRIRNIATNGDVTTIAGSGAAGYQDGYGTSAIFSNPKSVAIGSDGRLYVTDTDNNRIRSVTIF